MLANPQIARNYTKQNKYKVISFWNDVHTALNSAGPPTKTVFEWKKVWNDQKRYVRKKCAQNAQQSRATGGGPNKIIALSAAEESILQLIGGDEAVQGVDNALDFGFANESNTDELQSTTSTAPSATPSTTPNVDDFQQSFDFPSPRASPCSKRRKCNSITETVNKELKNQEELCRTIKEGVAETKKTNEQICSMTKRVYRALERANELKKKEINEQQRHNKEMEEQNASKIERKLEISKRMLEIEELKLKR